MARESKRGDEKKEGFAKKTKKVWLNTLVIGTSFVWTHFKKREGCIRKFKKISLRYVQRVCRHSPSYFRNYP